MTDYSYGKDWSSDEEEGEGMPAKKTPCGTAADGRPSYQKAHLSVEYSEGVGKRVDSFCYVKDVWQGQSVATPPQLPKPSHTSLPSNAALNKRKTRKSVQKISLSTDCSEPSWFF